MKEYRLVVLGSGNVGKTALTIQFVSGTFVKKYDPTVEDYYRKEIEVDNVPTVLEILDSGGTEQFPPMRDLYIRNGHGFVIVYNITSLQTFSDIKTMHDHIQMVKGLDRIPLILVGNKTDLESQRKVSVSDGFGLAQSWGCPYMETSAQNAKNVNDIFIEIVREIICVPVIEVKGCCRII